MDAAIFKALADGTRLRIIQLLSRRCYCVKALSLFLGTSEPAISQHMKVLRDAGLVEGVKFGYYTHYRLNRAVLSGVGDALKETATAPETEACDALNDVGCHAAKK